MGELPLEVRNFDGRFSFMLLQSLPDKMKARVFAEAEGDVAVEISTMHVLDTVWDDVAPGGQDEL
eukprot:7812174-Prorocentrum_lima.AAC.1